MTRLTVAAILLAAAGLLPFSADAAEVAYVQSAKAKVLAAPAFSSAVVGVADRGETVKVLEKNASWVHVSWKGTSGWVSALLLADKQPLPKVTLIEGTSRDLEEGARRRASAAAPAGTSRGLMGEGRERLSDGERRDYEALHKMEAIGLEEREVDEFVEGLAGPR